MMDWLRQYWPYALVLLVLCVLTGFLFKKAAQAYRKHQKDFHSREAEMRRLRALKDRYVPLREETAQSAPDDELLEGTALGLQLQIQKAENPKQVFASFSEEQTYIYALDVFLSDQTAAVFFKENGPELIGTIAPAFAALELTEFSDVIEKLAVMFDENDETTSVDNRFLEEADRVFSEGALLTKIKLQGANYIREHLQSFLGK